jgi:hypothetical protein
MAKTLKGILIDPFTCTIQERTVTTDYRDIYKQIDARCFDIARLDHGDAIYVDDEGMFADNQAFWTIGQITLAGKGFVLGSDDEGESVDCKITVEELSKLVIFRPHAEIKDWTKTIEKKHDNGFFEIIAPRPKFGPKGDE